MLSAHVRAENTSNVLLYIQPYEYSNEVKLAYFWQEYWFAQGPVVEPIAKDKLGKLYGNVNMCEGNDTGTMLLWLQPRMFYNGQAKLFTDDVMRRRVKVADAGADFENGGNRV